MNVTVKYQQENLSWLIVREPKSKVNLRLFCFPYAGGGASVFCPWPDILSPGIEVCAVQYPGRENRMSETPISNLHTITTQLFNVLLSKMDVPYAFFGHSMGAKIAFEIARKLSKERGYQPVCLFVSGCRAPHIQERNPIHHLQENEFLEALRRYDGTPESVLKDKKLMEVFLPMIRADFIMDEKYLSNPDDTVDFPIHAFAGDKDEMVTRDEIEAWRQYTTGKFSIKTFQGDHFFCKSAQSLLLNSIARVLNMYG
jgi:medium-chain acyl-[acyl-carrier-protein] hydrolase